MRGNAGCGDAGCGGGEDKITVRRTRTHGRVFELATPLHFARARSHRIICVSRAYGDRSMSNAYVRTYVREPLRITRGTTRGAYGVIQVQVPPPRPRFYPEILVVGGGAGLGKGLRTPADRVTGVSTLAFRLRLRERRPSLLNFVFAASLVSSVPWGLPRTRQRR